MRVQGCGGQGLLHEGMVAARGAERELNVECDFPQCLRQHRLQKETPGHMCFRVYKQSHSSEEKGSVSTSRQGSTNGRAFHLCALALVVLLYWLFEVSDMSSINSSYHESTSEGGMS